MTLNLEGTGTCTAATLENIGPQACPADSKAGFGGGEGAYEIAKEVINESFTLDFFLANNKPGHVEAADLPRRRHPRVDSARVHRARDPGAQALRARLQPQRAADQSPARSLRRLRDQRLLHGWARKTSPTTRRSTASASCSTSRASSPPRPVHMGAGRRLRNSASRTARPSKPRSRSPARRNRPARTCHTSNRRQSEGRFATAVTSRTGSELLVSRSGATRSGTTWSRGAVAMLAAAMLTRWRAASCVPPPRRRWHRRKQARACAPRCCPTGWGRAPRSRSRSGSPGAWKACRRRCAGWSCACPPG